MYTSGTAAGDPTEANWVGEAFGQRHSELLVGSVKGNIGCVVIFVNDITVDRLT
jgi:acyl transferase domain-containing protein